MKKGHFGLRLRCLGKPQKITVFFLEARPLRGEGGKGLATKKNPGKNVVPTKLEKRKTVIFCSFP